jgi:hypothetical protein
MKYILRNTPRVLLFLALAFGVTSCSWSGWLLSDTARGTFSERQSCPDERIKLAYTIIVRPQDVFETPAPPADVAADPGRLKVWTRTINDTFDEYMNLTLFDAVGCGAHLDYFCWSEIQNSEAVFLCGAPVDLDDPNAAFQSFRLKASAGADLKRRLQAGT